MSPNPCAVNTSPNLLIYLGDVLNSIRWDDSINFSLVKVLLLFWKGTLILLGGLPEVDKVKESFQLRDPARDRTTKPLITASPLDYHTFRQEITSKYPAYVPPAGTFPLEPEQKSLLPALRTNPPRSSNGVVPTQTQHGVSIINQPVHIATPAPSPPPSPAVGKGGKKQNYQTNQLFPFLYPPLDPSSNQLGGKGTTYLQDSLVSKAWEGSDIPLSILEASELFSSRIRATRSLKQVHDESEEFLRYERGWVDGQNKDVIPIKLDNNDEIKFEEKFDIKPEEGPTQEQKETSRVHDGSIQDRLDTVEDFYVSEPQALFLASELTFV